MCHSLRDYKPQAHSVMACQSVKPNPITGTTLDTHLPTQRFPTKEAILYTPKSQHSHTVYQLHSLWKDSQCFSIQMDALVTSDAKTLRKLFLNAFLFQFYCHTSSY